MAAQIMTQALGANNDPIESPNGPVFLTDLDAVAQIIRTRLGLLMGEWWENLLEGFPLFQSILDTSAAPDNQTAVMLIIQQEITGSPFVLEIVDFSYSIDLTLRGSSFACEVSTAFGTLTITNAPGSSAVVTF